MKPFYFINEDEKEELDLVRLFEYSFDYKVDCDAIIIALSELEKHIKIKPL